VAYPVSAVDPHPALSRSSLGAGTKRQILTTSVGRDTGSISAAARGMEMSYKRAWLLLDSINQAFETPAVVAATGGQRGGASRLGRRNAKPVCICKLVAMVDAVEG
jgi:molybdate transport repressor ModE-like protein